MTIGKLPATGPSPSPTQKNQEAPTTTGLASSKQTGLGPRAAKALPAQIRASPKPSPAPSGRTGAPDAPPAGTGGSAKTFWAQQDAASAKKPASRPSQSGPKTGAAPADASPPRPSRLRSASRPRRHRNPPTRPPAAPGQELLEPAKTQSVGKPTPSTNSQPHPLASPLRRRRSRQVVPRLDRRTKARPSPTRVPGNNPRRIPD